MSILEEITQERKRQLDLSVGGNTEEFDKNNSMNDWIAYVTAYLGRAAQKSVRNERENQTFRDNMLKAASLCVAAIEANDKGYFK